MPRKPKKSKANKPRNWDALNAIQRKAGPMKHKNTPKGGAKKKDYQEDS